MIYFIQDSRTHDIKIGYTSGEAKDRLSQLQTGNPGILKLLAVISGEQADEANLHRIFGESRIAGEWFKPTTELLKYILSESHLAGFHAGLSQYAEIANQQQCERQKEDFWIEEGDNGSEHPNQVGISVVMLCPVCKYNYSHIGKPEPLIGTDGVFNNPGGKVLTWEGRGNGIGVRVSGECGHNWTVCMGTHKGISSLFAVRQEDSPTFIPDFEEEDCEVAV